jgi:hypothetical protein
MEPRLRFLMAQMAKLLCLMAVDYYMPWHAWPAYDNYLMRSRHVLYLTYEREYATLYQA